MAVVTLNGTLSLQVAQTGSGILATATPVQKTEVFKTIMSASGVAADQCAVLHMKTYSFVASTPQTIDLTTILDIFGVACNFAGVRFIGWNNLSQVDGVNLLVGNSVTNEWDAFISAGATIKIAPSTANNSGYTIFTAPNTTGFVVDGTHKTLKMDPGANAFSVDLIIAGF